MNAMEYVGMQKNCMKREGLICLPVILLPAVNIILAILHGTDYDVTSVIPWVIGAVAEELFFRWLLLRQILLPRMKPVLAIVLDSVIFTAMHLINLRNGTTFVAILPQMFCAFCFSIWAGAVVWKTDRIWISLFAHVLLNATAIAESSIVSVVIAMLVLIDGILLIGGQKI